MSGVTEKINLRDRTLTRNASVWVALDWGGLLDPLAIQQAVLNDLALGTVATHIAVSDENWGIKEYQRDRSYELDQTGISLDRTLADNKVALGREQLAIRITTDNYTLAVKVFDAKVKALIMGVREYAAAVEREQLLLAKQRAGLAVDKEVFHQAEVQAKIIMEGINRAMVEADIAKGQVDVAKAQVRAIMADIEAGEADIKVITAQIEQYMAQAEKAGLQASVAMLFAEALTKKLSAVKLDVGQTEIIHGFEHIQSRLSDALTKLEFLKAEETLKVDYANEALAETNLIFPDEKASEDLRTQEAADAREVFTFTETATEQNIADETVLKALVVTAKEALSDQNLAVAEAKDNQQTWDQILINSAQKFVHKNSVHVTTSYEEQTEYIESGS